MEPRIAHNRTNPLVHYEYFHDAQEINIDTGGDEE